MPEPSVVQAARLFREQLLRQDAKQMAEMARRWLTVERGIKDETLKLAKEIAQLKAAGQPVTQGMIMRQQRYIALSAQTRAEMRKYVAWADADIKREIEMYTRLGAEQAGQLTSLSLEQAGLRVQFDRLSGGAMEMITGMVQDGAPLRELLANAWGDSMMGMTDALIKGTSLGWNPRKTARAMLDGSTDGLQRAMTIARTEQLRAFRMSNIQSLRASGMVKGYKRIAAKDDRTCLSCLASDGEFYDVAAEFADHPNGRCTLAPVLDLPGIPAPQWQTGDQWFKTLSADKQEEMMGSKRYAAWQDGVFSFRDLAKTTHSDTWGDGLRVATLAELGVKQDAA